MSLTEREKEIALECFAQFNKPMGIDVDRMFDLFLSRIREEQEAVGYIHASTEVGPPFMSAWKYERDGKPKGYIPLFTTQPAAPDCSELVEALGEAIHILRVQRACGKLSMRGEEQISKIENALANNAKRMKEK